LKTALVSCQAKVSARLLVHAGLIVTENFVKPIRKLRALTYLRALRHVKGVVQKHQYRKKRVELFKRGTRKIRRRRTRYSRGGKILFWRERHITFIMNTDLVVVIGRPIHNVSLHLKGKLYVFRFHLEILNCS